MGGTPSKSKFLRRAKLTAGIEVVLELEVDGVGDTLWGTFAPCPHGKGRTPPPKWPSVHTMSCAVAKPFDGSR